MGKKTAFTLKNTVKKVKTIKMRFEVKALSVFEIILTVAKSRCSKKSQIEGTHANSRSMQMMVIQKS